MRILMVCLGNICRSPLAEGILRHKIAEKRLNWEVDSAGTSHWHVGETPDPRSILTAQKHGLDITYQRSRQLKAIDLKTFDLILAMDDSNYRDILRLATTPKEEQKVKRILDFVEESNVKNVPDPYWDDDGFEKVYVMLNEACDSLIEKSTT